MREWGKEIRLVYVKLKEWPCPNVKTTNWACTYYLKKISCLDIRSLLFEILMISHLQSWVCCIYYYCLVAENHMLKRTLRKDRPSSACQQQQAQLLSWRHCGHLRSRPARLCSPGKHLYTHANTHTHTSESDV